MPGDRGRYVALLRLFLVGQLVLLTGDLLMPIYNITYDLTKKKTHDYESLYSSIRSLAIGGEHYLQCKSCLDSTWLIDSNASLDKIFRYIKSELQSDDKFLVSEISPDATLSFNVCGTCSGWLSDKGFTV